MNAAPIITELENNLQTFQGLLRDVPKEIYAWKEQASRWSLLEIVCHLCDEEEEDFRARVRHTLEHPELPLPSIDPAGWVLSRKYHLQDYNERLDYFLSERKKSIDWLRTLKHPDWTRFYAHEKFGNMSAGMFLCNWLAHDYLHIRQITKLKFDYFRWSTNETFAYAGDW